MLTLSNRVHMSASKLSLSLFRRGPPMISLSSLGGKREKEEGGKTV
jgi:hypothetical protein